ncbi:hypothetical protein C3B58_14540 [Lactonifactor longoviformis]|nr:hypothetical protein C3B58_14540 [Lactonifactor longoviformis]
MGEAKFRWELFSDTYFAELKHEQIASVFYRVYILKLCSFCGCKQQAKVPRERLSVAFFTQKEKGIPVPDN